MVSSAADAARTAARELRVIPTPTPLTAAEVSAVLAPLADARPFPGRAYHDEAIFAFERDAILARAWTCVGREDDVALPGTWLRAVVATESLVVVRGADLVLRAFYDVCRHRGAPLVTADQGRSQVLECPYHGFRYGLDGCLLRVGAGAGTSARARDYDLLPARVATWEGFVFVTLDPETPSLATWLGACPPWLAGGACRLLRRASVTTRDVACNYKLLAENFQESLHFPKVHPSLERLTPTARAETWGVADGDVAEGGGGRASLGPWLGGTMEITAGETVSADGSRHGRPLLVVDESPTVCDALLFPTFLTSLQPDYFLTYRLVPLAAARTRVIAEIFFHPSAFVPAFDPRDVVDFWARINAEDQAICEAQQRNVTSRAFRPAGYLAVEEGVHAYAVRIALEHARGERTR